jgi:hypothetical protein
MNYIKIYHRIINKALSENRKKGQGIYYERHHIIPRFMGGKDSKDNYVLLTAKEHFICHHLLTKTVAPQHKSAAWNAVYQMGVKSANQKRWISSRIYEIAKKEFVKGHVERHTGSKRKKETKEAQSVSGKNRWENEKQKGIKRDYSNSKGPIGYKQSEEHLEKKRQKKNKKIMVNGVIYTSRKEALENSGLSYNELVKAIKQNNEKVYYL